MTRWAFLLLVALLLVSTSGFAQGLDDVPRPDEIGGADAPATTLRIDWPAAGDLVKTPFTVTGIAAPGARLELWLGDQLERVFLADANGRFNTPVSQKSDGEIILHQVDTKGNRLQTASVAVVWAGAASRLAPSESESEDSTVTDEDAAALDPFGKEPAAATGLPKVSSLDTEVGADAAPIPPPPSGDPFSDQAGESPELTSEVDVQATVERPLKPPPSRMVRGLAEAGGGVAGALAIGFGGMLAGAGIGFALDGGSGFGALIVGSFGALIGMAVGLPAGVVFVGKALDGNGLWYVTILGELLGLAAGVGIMSACYGCAGGVLPLFGLPVLGAVLGYELSSDDSAAAARRLGRFRPTITPTSDGGYAFGLRMAF